MWQIGNTPDGQVCTLRNIRSIQKCSQGTQAVQCNDFRLQHRHHCWMPHMLDSQLLISGLALQGKAVHFDEPKTIWLHFAKILELMIELRYALLWHEHGRQHSQY